MDEKKLINLIKKIKKVSKKIKKVTKKRKPKIQVKPEVKPIIKPEVKVEPLIKATPLTEITKIQKEIKDKQTQEEKEKKEEQDIQQKVDIIKKSVNSEELKKDMDEINKLISDIQRLRNLDSVKRNKILSLISEFVRSPYIFLDNAQKKKDLLVLLQETGLSNLTSIDQKLSIPLYQPKTEKDFIDAFNQGIEFSSLYLTSKSVKILKNVIKKYESLIADSNKEDLEKARLILLNFQPKIKYIRGNLKDFKKIFGDFGFEFGQKGEIATEDKIGKAKEVVDYLNIENTPSSYDGGNWEEETDSNKYRFWIIDHIDRSRLSALDQIEKDLINIDKGLIILEYFKKILNDNE